MEELEIKVLFNLNLSLSLPLVHLLMTGSFCENKIWRRKCGG